MAMFQTFSLIWALIIASLVLQVQATKNQDKSGSSTNLYVIIGKFILVESPFDFVFVIVYILQASQAPY